MKYTLRQVLSRPDKEGRCRIVLAVIWAGQRQKMRLEYRTRHMNQLMERAGLTRGLVCVRYVQGEATEEVGPLWQVLPTHTARHAGLDMLRLGSGSAGSDPNLKEKDLGPAVIYDPDARERYGSAMLEARKMVLCVLAIRATPWEITAR